MNHLQYTSHEIFIFDFQSVGIRFYVDREDHIDVHEDFLSINSDMKYGLKDLMTFWLLEYNVVRTPRSAVVLIPIYSVT